MARQKKDYISLHIKFDAELMQRLNNYCDAESRTKTAVVERFVRACLNEYEEKSAKKDEKNDK